MTRHTSPATVDRYTVGRMSPSTSSCSHSSGTCHGSSDRAPSRPQPVNPAAAKPPSRKALTNGSASKRCSRSGITASPNAIGSPANSVAVSTATHIRPPSGASAPRSSSQTAALANIPPVPAWVTTRPSSSKTYVYDTPFRSVHPHTRPAWS